MFSFTTECGENTCCRNLLFVSLMCSVWSCNPYVGNNCNKQGWFKLFSTWITSVHRISCILFPFDLPTVNVWAPRLRLTSFARTRCRLAVWQCSSEQGRKELWIIPGTTGGRHTRGFLSGGTGGGGGGVSLFPGSGCVRGGLHQQQGKDAGAGQVCACVGGGGGGYLMFTVFFHISRNDLHSLYWVEALQSIIKKYASPLLCMGPRHDFNHYLELRTLSTS